MNNAEYLKFLKNLLPRMESLENSLSIIIQGPLNERIKESLPYYIELVERNQHISGLGGGLMGNVVISHWKNDDKSIIKDINSDSVFFVENDFKELPKYVNKKGSRGASPWILQNYSTLSGLKKATGNLCIKVRSDEIYPRLDIFYKKMKEGSPKFHTSDIFFRPDREEKFHISDHIIGAPRSLMADAFKQSTTECTLKRASDYSFPEQLICHSILRSRGVNIKDYKSKEIMKENFSIVPISSMPKSIWTCSYRKYDKLTSQETGWLQDIENI